MDEHGDVGACASGGNARSFVRTDLKAALAALYDTTAGQARHVKNTWDGGAINTSRLGG